jgi:thiamine pyrophosphate-dependent acetolactate synthase large subunit-like protein
MSADLLLMAGADDPYSNFLPNRPVVVHIHERPEVLGRRAPTALGVLGSARPTLKLLIDQVAPKTDTSYWDRLTEERRAWDRKLDQQADLARSADHIHPQAVARAVSDLANRDAVFVLDTGLNTLWSANWIRKADRSASSGRSTMVRSERRLGRPMASRRSTARGR